MIRQLAKQLHLLSRRGYHSRIIDHYENPRNVGSMDKNDKSVGTGLVGAPACGDVVQLQIRVDNGKVIETKFKTFGCGSAVAASSLGSEWVKGKTLEEASNISNREISNYLNLPPVKLHCGNLNEDAIKAAIHDYKQKNKENKENEKTDNEEKNKEKTSLKNRDEEIRKVLENYKKNNPDVNW